MYQTPALAGNAAHIVVIAVDVAFHKGVVHLAVIVNCAEQSLVLFGGVVIIIPGLEADSVTVTVECTIVLGDGVGSSAQRNPRPTRTHVDAGVQVVVQVAKFLVAVVARLFVKVLVDVEQFACRLDDDNVGVSAITGIK